MRWQDHPCRTSSSKQRSAGSSGDRATRRSVSAGVILRGSRCLKVWTKKQQVVALSSAESELCAAVKTASQGLGIQSTARELGTSCRLHLHLDASATMCLVNRRRLGKAKHVDMRNLWIQEASNPGRFATKKFDMSVNPADLIPKARIEQLMSLMGYEFRERHEKHVERPGDNDAGVPMSGGNSVPRQFVHQYGVSLGLGRRDGY